MPSREAIDNRRVGAEMDELHAGFSETGLAATRPGR